MVDRLVDRWRARLAEPADAGFTLPEMLIAIIIGGIIMGAVSMALIVAMSPGKQADARMEESHDAQLISLYLPADLLSVSPTGLSTSGSAPYGCIGGVPAGTINGNRLNLTWSQAVPTAKSWAVSYREKTVGTETQLVRYSCTNGGTATEKIVARNLKVGGVAVTVEGTRVSVTLTEASGFSYTVTGNRRTSGTSSSACTATAIVVNPSSVPLDAMGHLLSNVDVTIETSGTCSLPLQLTYTPDAAPVSQAFTGAPYHTRIEMAAATWTAGSKTLTVLQNGGGSVSGGSTSLVVTPYVAPCTASSVVASPNPVSLNSSSNLASSVTITVTTTGTCATPLKVGFTPSSTAQSVSTTGAGPYAATIGASAYTWTPGSKTLTITQSNDSAVVNGTGTLTVNPYVPPCTASSVVASPNPVSMNASSNLASNVTVTVTTTGTCSTPLKVTFTPSSTPVTLTTTGTGPYTATIAASAYTWTSGSKTVTVTQANDAAVTGGSATFTVNPACSVTSVVANPAATTLRGGNKLNNDIDVTVATTGSCSGLKLRYTTGGAGTTVTVALTQAGSSWTYHIDKNSSPWTSGLKALTVLNASDVAFAATGSLQVDP